MAQAGFDAIAAMRRLKKAGFRTEHAEAVVETVAQANAITQQVADDLADLKLYIYQKVPTRDELKELVKDFVTRDELKAELAALKAEIFRFGLIAMSIVTTLLLGLAGMIAYQSWAITQLLAG